MKFPFGKNEKDDTNPSGMDRSGLGSCNPSEGGIVPEKIGDLDLDDDLDREFHELGREDDPQSAEAPAGDITSEDVVPTEAGVPAEDATPEDVVPTEAGVPAGDVTSEDVVPTEAGVPTGDVTSEDVIPADPKEAKRIEKENKKKAKRQAKWEKKKLRRQKQTIKPILYGLFMPLCLVMPAAFIAYGGSTLITTIAAGKFDFMTVFSIALNCILAIISVAFMRYVRKTNKFDENFRFGMGPKGLLTGLIFGAPILVATGMFVLVNNVLLGGGYDFNVTSIIYAVVVGISAALFNEIVLIGVVFTNMVSSWRLRKHTVALSIFWSAVIYAIYATNYIQGMPLPGGIFTLIFFMSMGMLCSAVFLRKRNLLSLIILESIFWFFMHWIRRPAVVGTSKPWDYVAMGTMTALFVLVSLLLLRSDVCEPALAEFLDHVGIPDLATRRKNRPKGFRLVLRVVATMLCLALVGGAFYPFIWRAVEPRAFLNNIVQDYDKDQEAKKITGSTRVVSRNDVLSKASIENIEKYGMFRDLYYQDKAEAKNNVVFVYVIGSNLESSMGGASINIRQMMRATKGNPSLKFVLEAGGSKFWAFEPFMDGKVGRYEIANGKVKKVQDLGKKVCMTKEKTLKGFLKWGAKNYEADRYMLFFWDHGGGGLGGFGHDDVNAGKDKDASLSQADIAGAIEPSGLKFDLIGFDACLMQTLEWAYALEPYADYYLASEEVEPGTGWYWKAGFKALAEDPTLDTRELGRIMVSSYEEQYADMDSGATLSLVDLRQIPSIYEKVGALMESQDQALQTDANVFVEFYNSVSDAKAFAEMADGCDSVDLIDMLDKSNYENKKDLIECVQSSVLYRNEKGGEGVNGLAIYVPHVYVDAFGEAREAMAETAYTRNLGLYSDLMSMVAYQQKNRKADKYMKFTPYEKKDDYSKESWYNAAIAESDPGVFIDHIAITDMDGYYQIGLTDDQWETITDVKTGLYLYKDKNGEELIDLGSDNKWLATAEGHQTIDYKGKWVSLNGRPVALTPDTPVKTDKGITYSASTTAVLNGVTDIRIFFTWDPISEKDLAAGKEPKGHVAGYLPIKDSEKQVKGKGYLEFKPTDRILLSYDCYKKDGSYLQTSSLYAPIIVMNQSWLRVGYKNLSGKGAKVYGELNNSAGQVLRTDSIEYKK